jgi:hypothetical protein
MRSQRMGAAREETQIEAESIAAAIFFLRGQKVMLDVHLAGLYRVDTKALTRAVRRNLVRFPSDFMFQVSNQEFAILRRQIGTSSWGGRRHRPYAFTEQGVAMLSSVLRSKRAVLVNIQVVRTFVRLRAILASHEELARRLAALESRYDAQFRSVFDAIRELMNPAKASPRPIGFASWKERR